MDLEWRDAEQVAIDLRRHAVVGLDGNARAAQHLHVHAADGAWPKPASGQAHQLAQKRSPILHLEQNGIETALENARTSQHEVTAVVCRALATTAQLA